ncbi:MAG TPA: hypothetical protein VII41_03820, partial [Steroidobacteraceae bacterium]
MLAPLVPTAQSVRARVRVARWPLIVAALVVALTLTGYVWRGSPNQSSAAAVATQVGADSAAPMSASTSKAGGQLAGSMETMLARLQDRLAKHGGGDADWELLAQTYDFLGRKADATNARTQHQVALSPAPAIDAPVAAAAAVLPGAPVNTAAQVKQLLARAESARRAHDYAGAAAAYQQLATQGGMTAQTWADYADVTASQNGDRLAGAAEHDVDAALAIDPHNEKALWLKASAQHESKRYAEAIATWQQLLQLTAGGSPDAKIFAANLAEDQALAGGAQVPSAATVATAQVSGEVALADALRSQVPSGLTLFIVAKSLDSPGPPVAVVRTQTGQWPMRFLLDDS